MRVRGPGGATSSAGLVRFVALRFAIVPLFAGFVLVLFTERRRGLAGTVVLYA